MKIKSLLIVAMCAISFGAYAQTVMFYEPLGSNGWREDPDASISANDVLTANHNAELTAYKPASGNFYFNEPVYMHGAWDTGTATYPGASNGSILHIGDKDIHKKLTIQVNTSSKAYATLSYGHGLRAWGENGGETSSVKWSYSFDNSTWVEMPKADAIVAKDGLWDFVEHTENLGGKDVIYIRVESVIGSAQLDDIKITGYDDVPIFKAKLNAAISAAESFATNAAGDPVYCPETVAGLLPSITVAQAVADDDNATQEEVDAAAATLNAAVEVIKATALDFTAASEAISASEAFKASYLYANGAADLKTTFDGAAVALQIIIITGSVGTDCATPAQVDAAIATLSAAQAALEAQALDFTAANAAVATAEAFKLTAEYTAWSDEVTAAFDAALATLKAVIAANGVVEGAIISEAGLAAYITALEAATQQLIGVDGTAIEGFSIANGLIVLPAAADVQIYSASGALVLSTYAAQVEIAGLPAGVYVVKSNGASVSFVK